MCLAIPGKLESVCGDDPLTRVGKVAFGGIRKDVYLSYLPEAKVGDYVLVHVGFGIGIIDQKEAQRVFDYLREIGELDELGEPGTAPSPESASP